MKRYRVIGVPLDGSATAVQSIGVAAWLASRLGARLQVLHAGTPRPADETLRDLGVPEKYWHLFDFQGLSGAAGAEIVAVTEAGGIDLLVMTARGASAPRPGQDRSALLGHVAREVIERCRAPVLLLPPNYRELLPWRTALVPLSGEVGTDESLSLALGLAHVLDLRVIVAHVAAAAPATVATAETSDELHHEFPHRLNELVARACPMCTAEERARIDDLCLFHGDIAEELLTLVERKHISVIVVGWHGRFAVGHAEVLKTLIERVSCPLLLVKPHRPQPFRLKVGEDG